MAFASLHAEKGSGSSGHNDRLIHVPNADPEKTKDNFYIEDGIVIPFHDKEKGVMETRVKQRIKEGHIGGKIRDNAVKQVEFSLTGSYDRMMEIKAEGNIEAWAMDNYKFMTDRYGKENIVDFAVHMDERTPHIHCILVPLTQEGKEVKFNKKEKKARTSKAGRLSAKEVLGDKVTMQKLQTDYGELMQEKWGLERGIKGSKATHDSVKEYYGRIDKALEEARIPEINQPIMVFKHENLNNLKLEPPGVFENKAEWSNKATNLAVGALKADLDENIGRNMAEAFKMLQMMSNKLVLATEEALRFRKQNAAIKGKIEQLELEKGYVTTERDELKDKLTTVTEQRDSTEKKRKSLVEMIKGVAIGDQKAIERFNNDVTWLKKEHEKEQTKTQEQAIAEKPKKSNGIPR
jgi:hypothetical protein